MRGLCAGFLSLFAVVVVYAQELQELQKRVSEFTLANGMHFVVLERHDSPVIAFHTLVNVGSVNDPAAQSGMAHIFEHLAYKGTDTVGTRNWAEEKKLLDAAEEAYDRMETELRKGIKADEMRFDAARNQFRQAADTAQRLSNAADYRLILDENGAASVNAAAGAAETEFSYSLPSNRAELWFLMESQRLLHPVLREFYRERDVMLTEYRQRVETNPQGKLMAELLATAFEAHPYRNPQGGLPSDILNLRRTEAQAFFDRYYVAGNITIAMVGDLTAGEAKRLADRYFGMLPTRPLPPRTIAQEPPQNGPKTVVVEMPGQPAILVGYKRPNELDKDDLVFDLIQIILSQGRSSVLYTDLVQEKRILQQARAVATNPDGRFPNLFVFEMTPAQGRTVEEAQTGLEEVLQRLKSAALDPGVLSRAKAQGRANLIRKVNSDRELAGLLAQHSAAYGDWRNLFTTLDDLNKVKPEDVMRVAQRCFVATGRTTVYTVAPGQSGAPAAAKVERRAGGAQ